MHLCCMFNLEIHAKKFVKSILDNFTESDVIHRVKQCKCFNECDYSGPSIW